MLDALGHFRAVLNETKMMGQLIVINIGVKPFDFGTGKAGQPQRGQAQNQGQDSHKGARERGRELGQSAFPMIDETEAGRTGLRRGRETLREVKTVVGPNGLESVFEGGGSTELFR